MNVNNSIAIDFNLNAKRLAHSRGVAETAIAINKRYDLHCSDEKLYPTGLYHDIAREWDSEALVRYAREHNLAVSEEEMAHPVLLHAPVGAAILAQAGMDGQQVLAVRHHTLGSSEMGTFGQIIFCADYIEPTRTYLDDTDRARLLEEETIEALCMKIIEREWRWRRDSGREASLAGRAFYRYLEEELGR